MKDLIAAAEIMELADQYDRHRRGGAGRGVITRELADIIADEVAARLAERQGNAGEAMALRMRWSRVLTAQYKPIDEPE